ncbi:hypothetical protein QQF64_023715 [Cirrhinus molitorella]|uniref:Uncharacterized protein n=1 Tax=Cirrhinus molitorella TaxID=172907 RepID=A0ABR3NJM7_9TELE
MNHFCCPANWVPAQTTCCQIATGRPRAEAINPGSNPGHGIPFRAVVATALHRPMTPRTSPPSQPTRSHAPRAAGGSRGREVKAMDSKSIGVSPRRQGAVRGTRARVAQPVEHQTFNLRVQGSSPCSGDELSVCYRPSAEATRDVALDIDPLNALGPEPTEMRWPEIETESAAWKNSYAHHYTTNAGGGERLSRAKKECSKLQVTVGTKELKPSLFMPVQVWMPSCTRERCRSRQRMNHFCCPANWSLPKLRAVRLLQGGRERRRIVRC